MIEPISVTPPPLPGRIVASQRWSEVTFLHWRVPPEALAHLMPAGVRPDIHDGSSWVGLIAFVLDRASILGSPPVPYFGTFTEINVRLYGVDAAGRRGVVFLSLEAARLAAVLAARAAFSIPYFWSATERSWVGDTVTYRSSRHRGAGATVIVARPSAEEVVEDPTADFLTARWALFTTRAGRTMYLPNTHEQWPLVSAELIELDDTLLERAGISGLTARAPDSVLYSAGVTARFGRPARRAPGD